MEYLDIGEPLILLSYPGIANDNWLMKSYNEVLCDPHDLQYRMTHQQQSKYQKHLVGLEMPNQQLLAA